MNISSIDTNMFRPTLRPLPALRLRPAPARIQPLQLRLRHSAPSPVRTRPSPPPQHSYAPPPPPPRAERLPGSFLTYAFAAISLPIALVNSFPNTFLPPVADPASLAAYSKTPLTPGFVASHPLLASQLFIFRLRRGVYSAAVRSLSYAPADYISPDRPTPYAAWLTAVFSHGGMLHWGFCFMALRSLVPAFTILWGPARTAAFFIAAGTGASALECVVADYLHGARVRAGDLYERVRVRVRRAEGGTQEVVVMQPKEGLASVLGQHLGSSGALMGMLAVAAAAMPHTRWGVFLIPVDVPVRWLFGALMAWDVGSVVYGKHDGIGHLAHVSGAVVGGVLYAVWLRRVPRLGRIMQ
ncbi:hypothetical protein EDC01DRAFT_676926 [Geopyxis carbonaria]|nr:hypothetical protein EDC01DRAFT_676926 [Geopyxis carbonaria]